VSSVSLTHSEVLQRAAHIRLLVLDVDGVLTDGRLYFSATGETLKVFHARDGAGIVQLRQAGIQVAIISGRNSPVVSKRMEELGVLHVQQGIHDKQAALQAILQQLQIGAEQLACVGDDTPDLAMLKLAHLAVAVADAHAAVRAAAHFVTQLNGGQGAVREVCDLILQTSLQAQSATRDHHT
jgi:3-deoxy-D-manno-octulosonate 8-phosphate phosphatase (KDO 8-P phosphatase)